MATHTLSTGVNTLTSVRYNQSPLVLLPADLAAISQHILDDRNVAHPAIPGAFCYEGFLYVPSRGRLQVLANDVVAYDSRGWPILVSADSVNNGTTWTFT